MNKTINRIYEERLVMKRLICLVSLILVSLSGLAMAASEPAILPGPDDWTLNVSFEQLQQISVKLPGESQPKRFWYLILTLTNESNKDVDFYPKCELVTDTLQILPAGKGVPGGVFEQIKLTHQSKYPFLEPVEKAGNKILQGHDNTKDIAVIWSDFDAEAKGIKLYIGGLSNETKAVDHPTAKDENGKPVKIFLRKTLELSYTIAGDPALRNNAKITFDGKRWVMR